MNKWMRFVAMILALVMIVQTLPVIPASAAEHEQDAVVSQQSVTVQARPEIAAPEPEPTAPTLPAPEPEPAVPAVLPAADTEDLTWTLEEGVLTISGTGDMPNWTNSVGAPWVDRKDEITTVIVEEGITSVGDYAFASCYSLVSITLPEGVNKIGSYAFYRCSALTGIDLPTGVTALGSRAFLGCSALETIDIPEGVSTIGTYAFDSCSALRAVTLPGSLTEIQACTFQYCDKLESIVIPEGVTAIDGYAFYFCKTMTEISLPGSLTTIGNYAFSTCRALKSVEIPEGVISIGSNAFYDCRTMTDVTLPGTLTTIGSKAFTYCDALESVVIPDSVTDVGIEAFRYCPKLRNVQLSASMSRINSLTFGNCTALEAIDIPGSITAIDGNAFQGCESLTAVFIPDSVTTLGNYVFSTCTALQEVRLPGALTTISTGLFASCTALETIEIPETVTTINGYAFSNCSALKSAVLPEGLTALGGYVFSGCTALKSAVLPAGLTSLGNNAFYNCVALEEIHIPSGVTGLQASTFENCSSLHTVTIPEGLTQINSYAFKKCTALEEIVLPGSLTSMGQSVFSGCSALRTVTMPPRLSSFGINMFQSCSSLESIVIPEGVTAIGNNTFQHCAALESVTLPEGVTSIGKYALMGCTSLRELQLPQSLITLDTGALSGCSFTWIDLPDGLTTVGEYAFSDCTNLERIAFPDTVISLGAHALENCSALVEAVLPDGITELGACMFWNCTTLESVTLPDSLTSVGSGAFRNCPALEDITFPDTITTIADEAFLDCVALRALQLPGGLNSIGYRAFWNCTGLETLSLPASITDMGNNCFSNCTSLRELTMADGLTVLGSGTFYGCTALEQVEIPESVTRIEDSVFQDCSALREVVFHDELTDIGDFAFADCIALEQVILPDTVTNLGSSAFSGCAALSELSLSGGLTEILYGTFQNCSSLTRIDIPASVTTLGSSAFYGCTALGEVYITDSVTSIGYGAFQPTELLTFYTWPEAYAWSYAEQNGIRLVNVLTSGDLTLTVLDENGNVLTEGFTIEWYATDSDEVLATGSTLRGINKEEIAYDYRIILDEALSYRYRQPHRTAVVIENGNYDLSRTLSPIGELTLTGAVTDEAGTPVAGAALTLTQIYNGLYEKEITLATDADGAFSAEVKAVPTRVEVRADGCYARTVSADLSERSGTHGLQTLTMTALPADRITLSVEMVRAHEPGTQGLREPVKDPDALDYAIYNLTREQEITDFALQAPWLILGDSQAQAGDVIRISASDPENAMTAEPVVMTLDENRAGEVTVSFCQNGAFTLPEVIGPEHMVLMAFDGEGMLAASGTVSSGYTSRNLPAGEYQLVLLEKNSLLRSVASLDLLDRLGLTAGEDYALCTVTVQQELITAVEPVTVPELDEDLMRFVDAAATRLYLQQQTAYPEQMLTLRLSYRIDERYPSSGETVRIYLPEGVDIASDLFAGKESVPYYTEGSTLVVPVSEPEGELALYISAREVGSHHISATLEFETGGTRVLQPLGQARLNTTAGTLNVPTRTGEKTITVSGVTMPDRLVRVYVNGQQMAATTSNAVGTWALSVRLTGTYSYSYHEIQAKIEGEEEGTFHNTEAEYVRYDGINIKLSTVTMHNQIHYGQYQTTVFNFLRPDENLRYLIPDNEDRIYYSFRIDFTGDASILRNVVLVMTDMHGEEHRVRCRYDESSDIWLCGFTTKEYTESPTHLGVSYEIHRPLSDPTIDAEMTQDIAETITQIVEDTRAELEAIEYVDDGSTAGMDFYEMSELLDSDMDELERLVDEAEYLYDTIMEEAGLALTQSGSTTTAALGDLSADTTTVYLDEVDEEALLAEGYTKIMSTDGSCIYRLASEDRICFVDPVNKIKTIIVTHGGIQAAGQLASGMPAIFTLTETTLYKALDGATAFAADINTILETIERNAKQLESIIKQGQYHESKLHARVKEYQRILQVYIDMAIPEDTKNEIREMYARRLERATNLIKLAKQSEPYLEAVRVLEGIAKAAPVFGLIGSIKSAIEFHNRAKKLWDSLPEECPDDPGGLKKIQDELTNLSWFLYGKIALDAIQDIATLLSVFGTGVVAVPVTGGASLALAAVILAIMMTANYFTDKWTEEYVDIKLCDIDLMIRNLKCVKPKDPPDVKPVRMLYARVVLDPSGYVYEAVPSNRVEGVKAEIYYKDGEQDVLWDAESYDQVNPVYTDAAGFFHWDVPVGQWLVKFSKDGYYDTDSRLDPAADDEGYLPVPPPQTEVNTAIVSKSAPTVQSVRVYEDEVLVIFSQYMKPDTVGITVSCGGAEVSGTLAPSNAEWNYEQTEQYATVFRFTPDTELSGTADVTVNGVNYADTAMAEPWQGSMNVIVRPESIFAADPVSMVYGTEYQLEVQILPTEAGAGKTVTAESLAPMLLRVDTPSVTADENGRAIVTVYGELPGTVELKLGLEGTDLETSTEFTIALESETTEVCEKVTASIPNGSTVAPGTMLELYTATEGAEIYYTLDGTCPCVVDSPSRISYDGPITLAEDIFLIAYAVKEGAQDSPTSGFIYHICAHSDTLLENDRQATCTADGYTGDVICDDCGTVVEQGSVIPAPGHSWDEGVITVEPTENQDGEKVYTCQRCGETRTEVLPALNHEHSYESVVTEPTCTERGYITHTCRCGDSYTDSYTDALGHDMGQWFTVSEVTCTADGLERRECSRCDHTEEQTIETTGHDYESVVTEPTCTKGGYTTHTCRHCGSSYKDRYTNATGHDYESVVTEPTCTEGGYTTHTCTVCGNSYKDRYTNATGHAYESVVTEPTCTEGGFTTHTCHCGDSYVDSYTEALGHSFSDWTAAGNGMEERSCTRCGYAEQRPASEPVNPFTDVPEGSFYYEPVLWAVAKGITNGTTPTTFGPNDQCMRAHVVTFLWRAAGSPEPSSTENPFVDVKTTDFYYKAVLWAVEKGVTNGLDATHFGPFAYCNRAQVVTFLYRSLGSPAVESRNNPFTDVPEGQWFTAPVLWAVENGVTNGLSATAFGPTAICNRAQIVTFLYRAFAD